MRELVYSIGAFILLIPVVYIYIDVYLEQKYGEYTKFMNALTLFNIIGGIALMLYSFTIPTDLKITLPFPISLRFYRNHNNVLYISYFFMLTGILIATLPFYSDYFISSKNNEFH